MTDTGPSDDGSNTPPNGKPVHAAQDECPFCRRLAARKALISANSLCAAFYDMTPLNPGHVLIVPQRHEPDFLALGVAARNAILGMAVEVRALIDERYRPDGFNLGVNVGEAAGQTVGHAHLHVIPRYAGDVGDPRGGVRWLIPERARYWDEKQ